MTTWIFTADSTSVIKTLQDADPPREQTFNDLSLRMVDTIIYLYEAGQYASAVKFEQIGTIDGVLPTDLQDAFDRILAIIPTSGGGGGSVVSVTGNIVDNTDPNNPIASLTAQNFGTFINGLAVKSTPLTTDLFTLTDKADTNKQKKISTVQLSAYLKTYFDQFYPEISDLATYTNNEVLSGTTTAVLYTNYIGTGGNYTLNDIVGASAGDGYTFYVNDGTIILNGVTTYNSGDLVYRFFDGMVWTSKNFNNTSGGALIYRALLSQTGTSDPTAVVLENTFASDIVWTRNAQGIYQGSLVGIYDDTDKLFSIVSQNGTGSMYRANIQYDGDPDYLILSTADYTTTLIDDALFRTSIEILLYP